MEEDQRERLNRQLDQLVDQIRIILPGVTVLLAFLLTLPFTNRFGVVTGSERIVYYVTFLATAASVGLLVALPAYHRQRFQQREKDNVVRIGNELAIAAIGLLAVSLVGVVYLVSAVLFSVALAVPAAVLAAGWYAWFWFGLPRRGLDARKQDRPAVRQIRQGRDRSGGPEQPVREEPRRAAVKR
jgi:hypothetical protein